MAIKKWVIRQADKERASQISEKFNIDPFVAFLMVSRGIVDDIDVVNFMTDEFMLSSPFDMADMDEAVFMGTSCFRKRVVKFICRFKN